jgi:hypothetical protein
LEALPGETRTTKGATAEGVALGTTEVAVTTTEGVAVAAAGLGVLLGAAGLGVRVGDATTGLAVGVALAVDVRVALEVAVGVALAGASVTV